MKEIKTMSKNWFWKYYTSADKKSLYIKGKNLINTSESNLEGIKNFDTYEYTIALFFEKDNTEILLGIDLAKNESEKSLTLSDLKPQEIIDYIFHEDTSWRRFEMKIRTNLNSI